MDEAPVGPDVASFEGRMAGRLSLVFILDLIDIGRQGAPALDALLIAAIVEANVGRLNRDPVQQRAYARLDSPPPDALRRPISINALSVSLHQPFETVRRRVNQLAARGACVVTPSGVYVPAEMLIHPGYVAAARARYERLRGFVDELAALGAVEALPFRLPPAEHPDAPVRAVSRVLSDYFFRTTESLRRHIRDPMVGVVLLEIVRASSEHLSADEIAAALRAGGISDDARQTVRVAHLARRLAIPYETTRRHVAWLVAEGYCGRSGPGVIVTAAGADRPAVTALKTENLANIRRLHRQLLGLGGAAAAGVAKR